MAQGDQYFLASDTGEKFELTGDLSVGRSADCDLVVNEGQPSRQHARILVEADGVFVEDLGSTNGTFVNGNRITGKQPLSNGDKVAFDINAFSFEILTPESADATVLRQVEDPNRTVLRAVPSPEELEAEIARDTAAAQQAAVQQTTAESKPEQPVEEAKPQPAPAAKSIKPGSWADPNEKNASSTQFFSPEDLAAMRGAAVEEKVESEVPLLQVGSGSAAGSVIQLIPEGDKKEWTIGKDNARDIVFNDQGISDFHTILVYENGRWKVVDQMSTNGTYVNGSKTISGYLNSGDKIRIGTVECIFILPGTQAGRKAADTGSSASNRTVIGVVSFVVVLALMFGTYFFLM